MNAKNVAKLNGQFLLRIYLVQNKKQVSFLKKLKIVKDNFKTSIYE